MNNLKYVALVALLVTTSSCRALKPTAEEQAVQHGTARNDTIAVRKAGDWLFDYTVNLLPENGIQIFVSSEPTLDIRDGCGAGVGCTCPCCMSGMRVFHRQQKVLV